MRDTKEKPILYRPDMAQRVFLKLKTQTRRVVKPQPFDLDQPWPDAKSHVTFSDLLDDTAYYVGGPGWCPQGRPGDLLWTKEPYFIESLGILPDKADSHILYKGAGDQLPSPGHKWRNALFMPKFASRSSRQITSIRLEQVNEISHEDCLAEGIQWSEGQRSAPKVDFAILWDEIHKHDFPWASKPWVWVITFKEP